MKRKFSKFEKTMVILAVASLLAVFLVPIISGMLGQTTNLPTSGKRVKCDVTVRNPIWNDDYSVERADCTSQEALFCEIPLSLSGLSFFRQEDTATVEISSANTGSQKKTVTLDEGIVSGTLTDVSFNYCVPKENNQVTIRVLDSNNKETDSKGVVI